MKASDNGILGFLLLALAGLVLISCAGTAPPDTNVPNEKRQRSIHWAAKRGPVERIKHYLSEGGDPCVRDAGGSTLLHEASEGSEIEIVKLLIEARADVDARDQHGNTPLHRASICSKIEIAKLLIEAGADVDAGDEHGATPLHVSNGQVKMMRLLLDHGADVNARHAGGGATMLHGSCYAGREEAVRVLVEYGADVHAECWGLGSAQHPVPDEQNGKPGKDERPKGLTPLHMLTPNDSVEIAGMLLEAGADVNAKAGFGLTPLHSAAAYGDDRLAEFLLEHGAGVNAHWPEFGTPLDAAAFADREYTVAFLRRHGAKTGRELGRDGVAEAVWAVKKEIQNPTLDKVKPFVEAPLRSARLHVSRAVFDGPFCVVSVFVNDELVRFKVRKETGAIVDVEPRFKRRDVE